VLFVAHDASATGAPRYLERLVRWVAAQQSIDGHVLCWKGGPLAADLSRSMPTTVIGPPTGRGQAEVGEVALAEVGLRRLSRLVRTARARARAPVRAEWDLVVLNGAAACTVLPLLRRRPEAVFLLVHELADALDRSLAPDEQPLVLQADAWGAVADAVVDVLVGRGLDRARVQVLPGFVEDEPPPVVDDGATLRARLGLSRAPVVGGAGSVIPRKGVDHFVALAAACAPVDGVDPQFVWIGALTGFAVEVEAQARRLGVAERVHLVGHRQHPSDWFRLFDVFVSCAREDPLPLVALEAAQVGAPLVAFAQGGLPDLIGADQAAGRLVPPGDVDALAAAVAATLGDPSGSARRAEEAARRVHDHHTTSVVAPRVLDAVLGTLGGR